MKIINMKDDSHHDDIYKKLLEEAKAMKEITYKTNYLDNIKINFMKAVNMEGIEFINHEILEKQRNVLSYLLKKMGSNFLTGKSIMNISLPIDLFDSRSVLETFAYHQRLAPYYLNKAMDSSNLERLKLMTAFIIATFTLAVNGTKPFNPILGETFQSKVGDTLYYYEQTSHHPPIFNYYAKNPNYIAWGWNQTEINMSANSAKGDVKGRFSWKTNDGNIYELNLPSFAMSGIMMGNRYLNLQGSLTLEDKTNELISVVNFNPEEGGKGSFLGKLFTSKPKRFPDYFT
jgi:hypothetical protein